MSTTFLTELQAFISDHKGHDLSFDDQEFIVCMDCDETFELPEGTGVDVDYGLPGHDPIVFIEVPSGIANGHIKYVISPVTGTVEV